MNITSQAQILAQSDKLQHCRIFAFNGPSNCVVPYVVGQFSQHFKHASNNAKFLIGNVKSIRIRLVMHDACVLSFQSMGYSLDPTIAGRIEQNELHFWKRDQGVISND